MAADLKQRILVHGHRGARALRPENTLPAFEYAIAQGVDVLELDMAVTKDNVLVVSHDPILHPPVCSGPQPEVAIHTLTLAEVKEWDCGKIQNPGFPRQQTMPGTRMPTLEEVFALAPKGSFKFNIETKIFADHPELTPPPDEFVKLVLASIRKHHLESRIILQSFDFRTLHAMRKDRAGDSAGGAIRRQTQELRRDHTGSRRGYDFASVQAGDARTGARIARGGVSRGAVDSR